MIYLLRHGLDDESKIGGWSDVSLTNEGVRQVLEAKKYILENISFEKIISSDVKRAKQTALLINENINKEIIFTNLLREQNKGDYNGKEKSNNESEKIITEERIDKKTFERLLKQRKIINTVEKQRICFIHDDNLFKLDKFSDGMIILEANDEVTVPSYIKVIKEVSLDENYKNKNIKIPGGKNDLCKRRRSLKKI